MKCRHCQKNRVTRPRGLCWTCYYTDGVRDRYPSVSKYGHRGIGNFNGAGARPAFPTSAAPGSPEKLAILAQRAQLRQSLFHPDDAEMPGARERRAVG